MDGPEYIVATQRECTGLTMTSSWSGLDLTRDNADEGERRETMRRDLAT